MGETSGVEHEVVEFLRAVGFLRVLGGESTVIGDNEALSRVSGSYEFTIPSVDVEPIISSEYTINRHRPIIGVGDFCTGVIIARDSGDDFESAFIPLHNEVIHI